MLAARLFLRNNILLRRAANYCVKKDVNRPLRLLCLGGVGSIVTYSSLRIINCKSIVDAQQMEDPWLLSPVQKAAAVADVSLLVRLASAPWSVVHYMYSMLRMTWRCLVLWIRFVPVGVLYPLTSRVEAFDRLWWAIMLWNIQASGPTLIKLGQWASTRRDIFSKKFCDKLSVLHTKTKNPRLFRDCDKVLKELFGKEVMKHKDEVFPVIQPYSIGSGCIAQVADKGVEESIEMDLSILKSLAGWSQAVVPSLRFVDPHGALVQFEIVLRRQVDLRNEARALQKFTDNFDSSKTGIKFPIVVAYNKTSIAETHEEGIYINKLVSEDHDTSLSSTRQSTAVRKRIALMGARALLKMIFVDNFVHGDLHPGNILIRFNDEDNVPGMHRAPPADTLPQRIKDFVHNILSWRGPARITFTDSPDLNDEPTLVLLDTGIAISETTKNLNNLRSLFRAVVEKNGYAAGELLLSQSPNEKCKEPERFKREVESLVLKARSEKSLRTLNISALLSQLFNIVSEHQVTLDSSFTSVVLSVMVLEGFGRSLDPDLDLFQCARPYLLNVMM